MKLTQVSGSLKLVTGSPAAVSQVWLRAPDGRVQGAEYVTEAPDTVQVTGGAVSFDALPGALVMTLVSHGAPMHTVKLLVPDKATATLAECIEAAELASDGTRNALERLALEVQAELGQVPSLVASALSKDSTIIDAVQQASALRVDTTVGTRVFMGDIMIYGDTGWRVLPHHSDNSGLTGQGQILMRRQGNLTTVHFDSVEVTEGSGAALVLHTRQITSGFRPANNIGTILTVSASVSSYDYADLRFNTSLWFLSRRKSGVYSTDRTDMFLNGEVSWTTNAPWPTTLPGIPA